MIAQKFLIIIFVCFHSYVVVFYIFMWLHFVSWSCVFKDMYVQNCYSFLILFSLKDIPLYDFFLLRIQLFDIKFTPQFYLVQNCLISLSILLFVAFLSPFVLWIFWSVCFMNIWLYEYLWIFRKYCWILFIQYKNPSLWVSVLLLVSLIHYKLY